MTELSPAARAVLDATQKDKTVYGMPLLRPLIAAALHEAADRLPDPQVSAHFLHAIADELEAQ